jgi:hypothetical protein
MAMLLALACAALLAACGGSSPGAAVGGPGNGGKAEELAKQDVERRVAAALLPPGTHGDDGLSASYELEAAPFEPVTPNLVEAHAVFVTDLDLPRACAWIRAHPPAGVTPERLESGGATGTGHSSQTIGFSWNWRGPLRERELYETVVARAGGGSALGLDAQATWGEAGLSAPGESAVPLESGGG